jgi:hypothetical protein
VDREAFQREVLADLGAMAGDPLEFARYAFPWGEGDLAGFDGPDEWQAGILAAVRDGLINPATALRIAIASGHGIGKSALVAWLILWALATAPDSRGVVTANTDTQLRTKTWPELTKWHRRFIGAFMFEVTATAIYSTQAGHEKNWRVDLVPWSERNTEAFAGLHNKGKRILLVFDEASAIPEVIWETAEGALTDSDTEILWLVAGNPTRNSGRFRECFGKFRTRWLTRQIDSRTSKLSNKTQIAEWVNDYGEDSDFVRVRVRGVFPRAGEQQLIAIDVIEAAIARQVERDDGAPLVLGIDVARFGDDASVFRFRAGRDARTIPPLRFRGLDTMQLAGFAAEQCDKRNPTAVFVDGNGVGGGVVDRLRALGYPVRDVQAGGKARNERDYHNKTAECWGLMRDWLTTAAIDDGRELRDDLEARQYGFDDKNRLQLESKQDMKKRGVASPDDADALALTFAEPVARIDLGMRRLRRMGRAITEYATFG